MAVPLLYLANVTGFFCVVSSAEDREWTGDEIELLISFARLLTNTVERQHAKAELRAKEQELRRAHRLARLGSYTWDAESGEVTWTKELRSILGRESDEPSFDLMVSIVHPEDRDRLLKAGRLSVEVANSCLQYWGGMGFMWDNYCARALRDNRVSCIGGGSDETMLSIIAKHMGTLQ